MSDDVFRGMHPKKNHFALCQKQTKQGKKANLLSVSFLSFLFSLFSQSFLTTKNFFPF
jgi:hypothetical protein